MKQNTLLAVQAVFSLSLTAVSAYFDRLFVPVAVLFLAMVADYLSGMARAWVTSTLSSKTGWKGIIKKLCYLLAVCAGLGTDALLSFASIPPESEGFPCPVACLVAVWLLINELISILENLNGLGIPLPSVLTSLTNRLREKIDKN